MSGFTKMKATRQKIIDGYLSNTGRNMFVPSEFIDWLSGQPENEAYDWFFGMDDTEAAREHRIHLARQMASGLRIVSPVSEAPAKASVFSIKTREFPAYISPVSSRKDGGGYQSFDPRDRQDLAELQRQAASALRGWLSRYRGAAESAGADLSVVEDLVTLLDPTGNVKVVEKVG